MTRIRKKIVVAGTGTPRQSCPAGRYPSPVILQATALADPPVAKAVLF